VNVQAQLLTLLGVVIGALMSFGANSIAERARWRRFQSTRWDTQRLPAYVEFLGTVKTIAMMSARVVAARGIDTGHAPMDTDEGLRLLTDGELDRAIKFEAVLLLGDSDTARKAQELSEQLWRLEDMARGDVNTNATEFDRAYLVYRRLRSEFYWAARKSMGVPHAEIPLDSWPYRTDVGRRLG
jgi:hypothetical protein